MKYYLAYGSNLNLEEMKHRCPGAKALGATVLDGYQLAFCRHATVIEEPGCTVPVAVWEIDDESEKNLECYEGYPFYYTKRTIDVKFEGKDIEAVIYIMNKENTNFRLPDSNYLDIVTRGYISFNMPINKLFEALHYTRSAIENKKVFNWFSPEEEE